MPPPRRPLGRVAAVLVVALALVPFAPGCGPSAAVEPPPNVLLVVMDTTRGDRCGFGGYDRPTTPHLDALAASGVTYTSAWSPSPWTPPSHASMFSGLRPVHHGLMSDRRAYLQESTPMLAERLRAAGYATGAFVANPVLDRTSGILRGFDDVHSAFEPTTQVAGRASEVTTRALTWLDGARAGGGRFFLFLNLMEAHSPYLPEEADRRALARSEPDGGTLARARAFNWLPALRSNLGIAPLESGFVGVLSDLYDAEISGMDREIGAFLDELRARGVLDSTLVIVAGDHGENLGDRGLLGHMLSVHRSLLHVPLVIRQPGRFDGGRVVDDVVRLEDLAPTVLEVCGVEAPDRLDGESLLDPSAGRLARAAAGPPSALLEVAERFAPPSVTKPFDRALRSVFDGRHHLIRGSDGAVELYDLRSDPTASRDLSASDPETVARLAPLLDP